MSLPSGTITFLFTDIEGSTKLWEEQPEQMRSALARHDQLLRQAIEQQEGHVFKTIGDAFCAAFHTAPNALAAALAAQLALLKEVWPDALVLRVRMALHTGAAELRDSDYFGQTLNRVARLLGAGHGGQTLVSAATQELTRDTLPAFVVLFSLGEHRLRDLGRPETVFQLNHPDLPATFPHLNSLDYLPSNLPQQMTSFIGRDKEMAEIKTLLGKTRLLTLTGSGGCGKTRLSLQVAADVLENYPDGTWFVELASLTDPAFVPQMLAQVLNVTEEAGKPLVQTLANAFKDQKMLLVLDNCEHLLDTCARLLDTLLRACSGVCVLASSREALGIAGETVYRLPSLSLPDTRQTQTMQTITQYEAVRLFVERACAALPGFAVTNVNAPALASLCYRLDGIPLAIELAAARIRSLSVEEINSKLDNRFRLLTGGSRAAVPRQQTLRALIDWSYDLLNAQEKTLLRRLSVFAGSWSLAATEQVCTGENAAGAEESIEEWEMLDLLTSLADKSLVLAQTQGQSTRYRLLETVRQYALDRLNESGAVTTIRSCHADYFLALAQEVDRKLQGPEQTGWLDVMEEEHANLRQALAFYAEEQAADPVENIRFGEKGLQLAADLQQFWWIRGHVSEGRKRLHSALSHPGAQTCTKARAEALNGAGALAWMQSDYGAARSWYVQSLRIRRELGDRAGVASSLNNMGVVASCEGDYSQARELYAESLAIRRELGDNSGIATCLSSMGTMALEQGDYKSARQFNEESLHLYRAMDNQRGIASAQGNLGAVAQAQGDYDGAQRLHAESLSIYRELGDRGGIVLGLYNLGMIAQDHSDYNAAWSFLDEGLTTTQDLGEKRYTAYYLEAFASLAVKQAQEARSVRLWSAAATLRESIGSPLSPDDQTKQENEKIVARQTLGATAFAQAWEQGRTMTSEQSIAYALQKEQ